MTLPRLVREFDSLYPLQNILVNQMVDLFISLCIIDNDAGRQDKGRPAAFQAEDRGVRLSLPAPNNPVTLFRKKVGVLITIDSAGTHGLDLGRPQPGMARLPWGENAT